MLCYKILGEEFAHTHIRMQRQDAGVEPRECDFSGDGDIDKLGPVDLTRSCRLARR